MSVAAGVPSAAMGAWEVSLPRTRTPSSTVSPGGRVRRLSPPVTHNYYVIFDFVWREHFDVTQWVNKAISTCLLFFPFLVVISNFAA